MYLIASQNKDGTWSIELKNRKIVKDFEEVKKIIKENKLTIDKDVSDGYIIHAVLDEIEDE